MPHKLKRYHGTGDLHFITFSCYQRQPLLASAPVRDLFLEELEAMRSKYAFGIVGYVVMPEHVHLLLTEPQCGDLSTAIKALKQGVARRMITRRSPTLTHFWTPRYYDFNVWTEKKRIEKLRYLHRNPVIRGLVDSPEKWRWSSFRSYALAEHVPVGINTMFPPRWARSA